MAGKAGRVGAFFQRRLDDFENTIQVAVDFVIPKTKHPKALIIQLRITQPVLCLMRIEIVLTTIEFNNQFLPKTNEIDDEVVSRHLSAEVITALLP